MDNNDKNYRLLHIIDHIIPQSEKGDHGIDNLQLLCWRDNHYRSNKSMEFLFEKLLNLSLISKSTFDKQTKYWQELRKQSNRIAERYNELYPSQPRLT